MIEQLKAIISETLNRPELLDTINENTNILNDIGTDSLQFINLMLKVEEEFDVEINFDNFDISHFKTMITFSDYIKSLQKK